MVFFSYLKDCAKWHFLNFFWIDFLIFKFHTIIFLIGWFCSRSTVWFNPVYFFSSYLGKETIFHQLNKSDKPSPFIQMDYISFIVIICFSITVLDKIKNCNFLRKKKKERKMIEINIKFRKTYNLSKSTMLRKRIKNQKQRFVDEWILSKPNK